METRSKMRKSLKIRNRLILLIIVEANLPRGVLRKESQQIREIFSSARSTITKADLKCFVKAFNIPKRYKLLAPPPQDRAAYPLPSYVALSHQHLQGRLRLLFHGFLIDILNLFELTPFQLSPNFYFQLIYLYLIFWRHDVPPPSNNIIQFCFTLKKNPTLEGAYDGALHDEIYYLPMRAHKYKKLLSDTKSNAGPYKISFFFVKGPKIRLIKNMSLVFNPRKFST
ncbi:hypothetical protein ACOSQ2_010488 [Xanthoceras sorbifolium]